MSTLSELLAEHTRLRPTPSSTCSASSPSGSCSPTCPSPTSCCGSPSRLAGWPPGTLLGVPPRPPSGCAWRRPGRRRRPTAHPEDVVAARVTAQENPQLRRAVAERRICREEDPRWHLEVPVRRETIPVRRGNAVLAVLSRDTNLAMPRVPSPLEIAYLGSASDLCQMIADGTFPPRGLGRGGGHQPARGRRADPPGRARPRRLRQPERALGVPPDGPRQRPRRAAARRRHPRARPRRVRRRRGRRADPRRRSTGGTRCAWRSAPAARSMLVRALPLRPRGTAAGALVLVRDITDLRRRDLALLSKDATIREIHHRVKNNLQTVAALLRLQARRTAIPEARRALARACAGSTRSRWCTSRCRARSPSWSTWTSWSTRCCRRSATGPRPSRGRRCAARAGFGILPAALATPLVLVLTELVHNALAHAFEPGTTGEVCVTAHERSGGRLDVVVADDGVGMPPGFDPEHPRAWACRSSARCWARSWIHRCWCGPAGRRNGGRHQPPVARALTSRP